MKLRLSLIFLIFLFTLFHFSPQLAEAEVEQKSKNEVINQEGEQTSNTQEIEEDLEIISDAETTNQTEQNLPSSDTTTSGKHTEKEPQQNNLNQDKNENIENPTEEIIPQSQEKETTKQDNKVTTFSVKEQNVFQQGDRHNNISSLKEKLNYIGFGGIKITNYYGSFTKQRVMEFQENYGLQVTGKADQATIAKLEEVYSSPFQYGNRHDDIVAFKKTLNQTQFGGILVTDYYGSFTEKKVKDLQRHLGLKENGIADAYTRKKLNGVNSLNKKEFGKGDRHADIEEMKVMLNAIGFDGIKVTDYFGSFTELRVTQFQNNYGLESTGKANELTLKKLNEVYSSPFQLGKRNNSIIGLKEKLNTMGFGKILVTDYYGFYTVKKIKELQQFFGLKENGIADSYTRDKLNVLYDNGYGKGDRHEFISAIKTKLNAIGFGGIKVTDYYGSFTEQRVRDFQEFYGLSATGKANAITIKKLEEIQEITFSYGDRHSNISKLKERLNSIGFGNILVTDYYGEYTKKKVKDFQQYYNLTATGKVDPITWKKIREIYEHPYQMGNRHKGISSMKEQLNKLGFGIIQVTTYFGNYTDKKVKEFQEYHGLVANGIIDENTQAEMNRLLDSPFQVGRRHKETIQLKENLNSIGYGNIKVTDYYGSFTKQKVKEFQSDNGLPVSGIADEVTRKEIESRILKIFLDPGHGAHDPGAQAYGLMEKNVVLDIALETSRVLSENYYGVNIKLSKTTDEFIELADRAEMANRWGADYFVSFHANSLNGNAYGFESYIYNGYVSSEAKERQKDLHQYLINKLNIRDRGMKEANFSVLRNTNMPAILLEYMFIDNFIENGLLKDASYRKWLGKITADAIANSFNLKRR
ncbi:hypothetical protein GLW20_02985 [Virgibacillus halodenitrificans]|nr:hypothetical protein [Virgibacillus halodenitrificans]